jgi:hypothetical protein
MAMAVIIKPLNDMLADPAGPDYARAHAVVTQATSCQEAVNQLGVLNGQSPKVVHEAAAVFGAMPAQVDQAILDKLRSGFGRQAPMALHWEEDTGEGEPTVAHRFVEEEGGWLHVHVSAPNGQKFT